jgi:sugar-specific transcriptional regulator TrmB
VNIYEALERAAELRTQADELRRQADELEHEWIGVAAGETLTVEKLVDVIRKIGGAS